MPDSSKIVIGAIITFIGIAGLSYMMPITTNAAASKGPVFKETDVPKYPAGMMMTYIPLEIGAAGALIAGISVMSIGLVDTPLTTKGRA